MEFITGKDHGKIEQVEMNFLFYGNVSSQFAPLGIFKVTRFFKFQMNPDSGGGWGGVRGLFTPKFVLTISVIVTCVPKSFRRYLVAYRISNPVRDYL